MGLYKYLLFIFVLNDVIYTNVHYVTKPVWIHSIQFSSAQSTISYLKVVTIRGDIYFLFSSSFPERWRNEFKKIYTIN